MEYGKTTTNTHTQHNTHRVVTMCCIEYAQKLKTKTFTFTECAHGTDKTGNAE